MVGISGNVAEVGKHVVEADFATHRKSAIACGVNLDFDFGLVAVGNQWVGHYSIELCRFFFVQRTVFVGRQAQCQVEKSVIVGLHVIVRFGVDRFLICDKNLFDYRQANVDVCVRHFDAVRVVEFHLDGLVLRIGAQGGHQAKSGHKFQYIFHDADFLND